MKICKHVMRYVPIGVILLSTMSCSDNNDAISDGKDEGILKTCALDFNISCSDFDGIQTRNTSESAWKENDKVYLTFGKDAYGVATFKQSKWDVEYYGTLPKNIDKTCKVVYFENPSKREAFQAVDLTSATAIYEDTVSTYLFDGSLLTITANLQPKTGRLRFKGESDETIHVHGLTHSTRYSVFKGTYEETLQFIELKVQKDGFTPYVHGVFTDTLKRRLNVATSTSAYSRQFADSVMHRGESGWLSVPKEDSCFEWKNKMIFRVKTTEFAMIPVTESGALSFLIGETEVTKGLYNALTDSVIIESDYPQPFSDTSILDSLKKQLGIDFKLPTSSQWQWAYKGGDKSQGYTYSGSNTVSEVAWYSANSEGKAHEVATLIPNELGIYDMAGNLAERIGSYQYGGNYSSAASSVTYNSYSSASSNYGIRLTISF